MVAGAPGVEEFERYRSWLFGLAYRMLSSAVDAEDVVQDAFLRWNGADRARINTPSSWLAKVVTNLCLTRLNSAQMRRERYVGPWLPEPVLTSDGTLGPLESVEQRDTLSLAFLTLAERLGPTERAVFVLREAFSYSHREIAELLDKSEAACRQLHRRARQRLAEGAADGRTNSGDEATRRLIERFLVAARSGDVAGLERLLADDVTSWADGGGEVTMARRPVSGRAEVARYLAGVATKFGVGVEGRFAEVNGEVAILAFLGGQLVAVFVPEIVGGEIAALRVMGNPAKLEFLRRQLGVVSRIEGLRSSSW